MFYKSEKVFIDCFIATLCKMKVSSIPYEGEHFTRGVDAMRQYFYSNRASMGSSEIELRHLFLREPVGREYAQFAGALTALNGELLSFPNPSYENAVIAISERDADLLLEDDELGIAQAHMDSLADHFCQAAEICEAAA